VQINVCSPKRNQQSNVILKFWSQTLETHSVVYAWCLAIRNVRTIDCCYRVFRTYNYMPPPLPRVVKLFWNLESWLSCIYCIDSAWLFSLIINNINVRSKSCQLLGQISQHNLLIAAIVIYRILFHTRTTVKPVARLYAL